MIYIVISNLNTGGIVTMPKKDASVNQITEGVIWKQLLIFFFPIMLGTLFQQLYNTADAVVVGRFVGTKALAAVGGSTGQITNLIVNFFVALASGATVIIARYYGAKNKKDLNDTLHTAAALSIAGGILTTVVGVALAPILLKMMKTPADVMPDSVNYLRIYFAGIIFVFIYNVGSATSVLPDRLLLHQYLSGYPSGGRLSYGRGGSRHSYRDLPGGQCHPDHPCPYEVYRYVPPGT